MNIRYIIPLISVSVILIILIGDQADAPKRMPRKNFIFSEEDIPQEGGPKRREREWRMLRDPKTGRIPAGIRDVEM
jgi:hypothetical protein